MSKRIVILGAGESGTGAAVLAKKHGLDTFVSDASVIKEKYKILLSEYNIDWEQNVHTEEKILNAHEVVKSPGIPDNVDIINKIKDKGIRIISEIEFAGRYTNAKRICITGSNGKTTTASLIYHILKNANLNAGLAGNVGNSLALQVAEKDFDYYVIELSSFQLDGMNNFKTDIAILLNITPDHLDRYNNKIENYIKSKFRILQNLNENDFFIYCSDDEIIINEIKKHHIKAKLLPFSIEKKKGQAAFIENKQLKIQFINKNFTMLLEELALEGRHNTYNSMAAGISAQALNLRKDIIRESLSNFQGVEHRLERFLKIHGIEFINDSKATNVNSTWYALECMHKKVVWIVGGIDKGNDYSILKSLVTEKVKAIVCLGKDNLKIHKAFSKIVDNIVDTESMKEAVKTSYYLAKKDDVVLLSPACASFDLFENYEDRGWQFKNAVKNL